MQPSHCKCVGTIIEAVTYSYKQQYYFLFSKNANLEFAERRCTYRALVMVTLCYGALEIVGLLLLLLLPCQQVREVATDTSYWRRKLHLTGT